MLSLLRNRRFAYLWAGQSVSVLGDWVRHMTVTYWAYQVSGHSPTATAAMAVADALPALTLGPLAGVFASRWSQRKTLFWTRLICAICSACLALLTFGKNMAAAYVVAFISSAAAEFYYPARQAMTPAIVERDQIVGANSLTQMSWNVAIMLGPVIGTAIYFATGPQWALGLDALSFLIAAWTVHLADLPANATEPGTSWRAVITDLREGLVYVTKTKPILYTTIAFAAAMFAWGMGNICELFLITRNLGLPESRLSLSLSIWGMTMIGASVLVYTISRRLANTWPLVVAGLVLTAVNILGIGLAPTLTWILFMNVLGGSGNAALSIGANSLLQTRTEPHMLTRVFGFYSPAVTGASLLGNWLGGVLAKHLDVRLVYYGCSILLAMVTMVALRGFLQHAKPVHPTQEPHYEQA